MCILWEAWGSYGSRDDQAVSMCEDKGLAGGGRWVRAIPGRKSQTIYGPWFVLYYNYTLARVQKTDLL